MAQYDLVLTQNVAAAGSEFTERFVTMAKGTLISANASNIPTALAAGTNGYVLSRDDAEATGLKWVAAGANYWQRGGTVLSPATSGDTLSIDSITVPASTGKYVFGDGDSYFYESTDDQIMVYLAAAARWRFTTGQFRQDSNGGPSMQAEGSTATNPVFCPINSDASTGIGGAATQVSTIISSTEIVRVTSTGISVTGAANISGVTEVSGELRVKTVTQKLTFDTTGQVNSAWIRTINDYDLEIYDSRGSSSKIILSSSGQVELFHGVGKKFETTAAGATITGTVIVSAIAAAATTSVLCYNTGTGAITYNASGGGTTNFLRADGTWAAPAGGAVSVANQADNRIITATGTTDALNAEANLTFDGTTLTLGTGSRIKHLSGTSDRSYIQNQFAYSIDTASNLHGLAISVSNTNATNKNATVIRADNVSNDFSGSITGSNCFLAMVSDGLATINTGFYSYGTINSANAIRGVEINIQNSGAGTAHAIYVHSGKIRLGLSSGTPSTTVGIDSSGNLISYANPGGSGVSVANQADNRLITATATTDALNAEGNITFDGTNLILGSASGTFAFQSVTYAFIRSTDHLRVLVNNVVQQSWYDDETVFYSKITNHNGTFQSDTANLELRAGGSAGYHASVIPGFKITTGSAGNLYLQRGLGGSGAAHGGIYFGDGTTGHLAAVSGDTNVVYYNTTTGKLSYGTVSGGTTINNNADNRVITGSNTANTLEGESTLTYSAGSLTIAAGATRYFTVGNAAASTAGDVLIIRSGAASTSGYAGGNLNLIGGDAVGSAQSGHVYIYGGTVGTAGNVSLCHSGSTAYGYVGIRVAPSTSYSLKVAGEVYSDDDFRGANFILNSDIRLKQNVVALKPEYLDIDYSQFEFKNKPFQLRFGVIAQQVGEKYPELIREKDGELAVAYTDLLIREIAYLKDKVKELERRMN